jgi:hypothetical protein
VSPIGHTQYSNTITQKADVLKIPFDFPDLSRRKALKRRLSFMNKTLQNLSRFRATVAIATGRGAMFDTLNMNHSIRFF